MHQLNLTSNTAALRGLGAAVDVRVYTAEEFESRAALPVSFERTVKTKGVTLHAA